MSLVLLGDARWNGGLREYISNEMGKTWTLEACTGHHGTGCVKWDYWHGAYEAGRIPPSAGWDC